MQISQRLLFAPVLAVGFAALTMVGAASAADYSVAYALETDSNTETGTLENCTFGEPCRIKFRVMDATARLTYFSKPDGRGDVMLAMDGDSACCYFKDGNYSISLDPKVPLHAVVVYAGHARRGNEVVRNQQLGTLYLSFAKIR
jgi:hypothetical protein